jgi:hypothetical protein
MFWFCLLYFWFGMVWFGLLLYSVEEISNLGGVGEMSRMNSPANNRNNNIKCKSVTLFYFSFTTKGACGDSSWTYKTG